MISLFKKKIGSASGSPEQNERTEEHQVAGGESGMNSLKPDVDVDVDVVSEELIAQILEEDDVEESGVDPDASVHNPEVKRAIARKFLDSDFYRKLYPDLPFEQHDEFVEHFASFGMGEFRDPCLLLSHHEFGVAGLSLTDWLRAPDYSQIPSPVWKKALLLLGLEPDYETFVLIFRLINVWKLETFVQAELLWQILAHTDGFDEALAGSLPAFFTWGSDSYSAGDDVQRYHAWVEAYENTGISFAAIFDEKFYGRKYQDISGINLFRHFLEHGSREGRLPSALFSSYHYHRSDRKGLAGFYSLALPVPDYATGVYHFLSRHYGRLSVEVFYRKFNRIAEILAGFFDDYASASFFLNLLGADYIRCRMPEYTGDALDVLEHWLADGSVVPFSPFFCKSRAGGVVDNWLSEYRDWFRHARDDQFVPCDLYDESFYLLKQRDLASLNDFAFFHFVNHGQFENRQAHPLFDLSWIATAYNTGGKSSVDFYFAREAAGKPIKSAPSMMAVNSGLARDDGRRQLCGVAEVASECAERGIFDFSPNSELLRVIKAASVIDPLILPNDVRRMYSVMPFNNDGWGGVRCLPELVGHRDILVFRDGINFGGADVVLKYCYAALKKTGLSVGVISLGDVDYRVVDEHGINRDDVINLANVDEFSNPYLRSHLIYDIVVGSCCRQVVNLNCGALWAAIEDYGRIMAMKVSFSGFMFCDDRDGFGNVAGYPARYFISTIRHLDALYVDSLNLKRILLQRAAGSRDIEGKIHVLHSPIEGELASTCAYVNSLAVRERPAIAWAGRFDEQKCPDLLRSIAERMPDVDFYVWGKSVLSTRDYKLDSVTNIRLMGLYKEVEEIAAAQCDLYLYTSLWDGVPTILLRIQELGLPIVASDVGGVAEALPEVALIKGHEPEDYVARIRHFLENAGTVAIEFDMYKHQALTGRTEDAFTRLLLGEQYAC